MIASTNSLAEIIVNRDLTQPSVMDRPWQHNLILSSGRVGHLSPMISMYSTIFCGRIPKCVGWSIAK